MFTSLGARLLQQGMYKSHLSLFYIQGFACTTDLLECANVCGGGGWGAQTGSDEEDVGKPWGKEMV